MQKPLPTAATRVKAHPSAASPACGERRAHPRTFIPLSLDAILLDTPGQPEIKILGTDTSQTGMAFESAHLFGAGERVAIKFRLTNGTIKLIFCRTRYCHKTGPDRFHVGVEFIEATLPAGICTTPQ